MREKQYETLKSVCIAIVTASIAVMAGSVVLAIRHESRGPNTGAWELHQAPPPHGVGSFDSHTGCVYWYEQERWDCPPHINPPR
jgi:hypothetical protein